jgi:hypothetical protein
MILISNEFYKLMSCRVICVWFYVWIWIFGHIFLFKRICKSPLFCIFVWKIRQSPSWNCHFIGRLIRFFARFRPKWQNLHCDFIGFGPCETSLTAYFKILIWFVRWFLLICCQVFATGILFACCCDFDILTNIVSTYAYVQYKVEIHGSSLEVV